ncbi:PP2C family serine/threonine-protein phosphatase [Methanoregula sp.]|uniref:PP2C family serine/threonine-protein phosphatase n=1 Tax=Methanoregula sp. TaxID=2052170 RepID=UPI002CA6C372|nr:PP2C family serine/threonine-protein phosphatase [Methanoregula sp.]HVP96201.1 PP2C family serine/threonine-protein phosphatase [Methanoregula sp.]
MIWKHLSLSVTGKSHSDRNEPGQDYCRTGAVRFADRDFFIGLAADGAGSTIRGGIGAEIACETLYLQVLSLIRTGRTLSSVTDDDARAWIAASREAILIRAQDDGQRLKDYACTLIGSVLSEDHAIFFQIGDGCIVTGNDDGYHTVFWPEQGEYANTTFFVSDDDFLDHIRIDRRERPPGEIALFTDGLQNLVLSFSTRTVHEGFFRPLFTVLRKNPEKGGLDLTAQLHTLLTRDDVTARSDDDKTLILAVNIP